MRTKLVIAAVATAGVISAVGASAYTDSIQSTPSTKVVGYASTTINGATMATDPVFHYNSGFTQITGIDVVLVGNTTASTLYINQNGANAAACTDTHSGHGVYDGTTNTTYLCTGLTYAVASTSSIGYALQ